MIYPKKLKKGSHIRVIAPSRSFSIISQDCRDIALKRFEEMDITVSYSKNSDEIDDFLSSSVESRLDDLHEAFSDSGVDGILTAIGGFNTNQLIDKIDYNLIKKNPKIICGFSDITCLCHAITSKTDMVTYSGPHFSSFGMLKGFDYTLEYFRKCLMQQEFYRIYSSDEYSEDEWFIDQKNRDFESNHGFKLLNKGKISKVEGKIVGGHVRCLSSLQGTKFWMPLDNSILFLEEDEETNAVLFDRLLQSLIQQKDFRDIKALVIGRFKKSSQITSKLLEQIIKTKKELADIPVVTNIDIGHTSPIITYPIGGNISLEVCDDKVQLTILNH